MQTQSGPKQGATYNICWFLPFLPPGWPKNELNKAPENIQMLLKYMENDKD